MISIDMEESIGFLPFAFSFGFQNSIVYLFTAITVYRSSNLIEHYLWSHVNGMIWKWALNGINEMATRS